jgi:hypothetical protein
MSTPRVGQAHRVRITRRSREQPEDLRLGLAFAPANRKPMRALRDEKTSEQNEGRRNDRGRIHPAPRFQIGIVCQNEVADRGSDERASGLESKGREHKFAAAVGGSALGNHQMSRRVVASEGEPHSEQAHDQPVKIRRENDQNEKQDE